MPPRIIAAAHNDDEHAAAAAAADDDIHDDHKAADAASDAVGFCFANVARDKRIGRQQIAPQHAESKQLNHWRRNRERV